MCEMNCKRYFSNSGPSVNKYITDHYDCINYSVL